MTDLILPFIPFVAAVAFFIRARGEQKQRRLAEQTAAELRQRLATEQTYRSEWLATLAHELRTPLAAIIGYGELLEDGTLGQLGKPGTDAITRIRLIADQILHLVDGVDRAAGDSRVAAEDDPRTLPVMVLIDEAVEALRLDAEARQVKLNVRAADLSIHTRPADASRAIELALGAAIKSGPGNPIDIGVETDTAGVVVIERTKLDPRRDDPNWARENSPPGQHPHVTGAALRLGMARRIAEVSLGGRLELLATPEGCTVRIELPRLD